MVNSLLTQNPHRNPHAEFARQRWASKTVYTGYGGVAGPNTHANCEFYLAGLKGEEPKSGMFTFICNNNFSNYKSSIKKSEIK